MRKMYVEASRGTEFFKEKRKPYIQYHFPWLLIYIFSFIHNENLLNCHFLANNLRLPKAKEGHINK